MSDDAQRFRRRAIDCRNISKGALNVEDRWMLEEIADELDDEARRIEAASCDQIIPTNAAEPLCG